MNKRSKNFCKRLHRRGGWIFHGRQYNVTLASQEHCSRLQQSRCYTVSLSTIELFFAAYTASETPNAFQWAGQPLKLPLPVGDLDPI